MNFFSVLIVFVKVHTTGKIHLFSLSMTLGKLKSKAFQIEKNVLESQVKNIFRVESWMLFKTWNIPNICCLKFKLWLKLSKVHQNVKGHPICQMSEWSWGDHKSSIKNKFLLESWIKSSLLSQWLFQFIQINSGFRDII